jgi:hypothetical protein
MEFLSEDFLSGFSIFLNIEEMIQTLDPYKKKLME